MVFPLSQTSRYINTPLISFDGKETYGKWVEMAVFKNRPPADQISKYQVPANYAGRIDLVALDVYNDVNLGWVLVAFNNARDVFGWPSPLDVIEYPNLSLVFKELL
jgi:hypothetical protein